MPTRQAAIELTILEVAKEAAEYQFREEDLFNQVRVRVSRKGLAPPSTMEMKDALQRLDTKLQMLGVSDGDEIRWSITTRGTARLAKESI